MPNHKGYIKTGFDVLDKMLGGEGIKAGTSVLVRGQPGSGKTTLVLQMINSYLENNSDYDTKKSVLFISLEEDYKRLIKKVTGLWQIFYS